MLLIDNDQFFYAFEHLNKAELEGVNVLHYATHLNDLLIAQKEEAREIFALILNILRQVLHDTFKVMLHRLDVVFDVLRIIELFVSHVPALLHSFIQSLHIQLIVLVDFDKDDVLMRHLPFEITAIEDWGHVGPELLHSAPLDEEFDHLLETLLQNLNLLLHRIFGILVPCDRKCLH